MIGRNLWPPSPAVRVALALGLALLGVVLVWASLARPATSDSGVAGVPGEPSPPPASPSTSRPAPPSTTPSAEDSADLRDKVSGQVLPESEPVTVSISRIGVRSRLVPLDLRGDGTLAVPDPWQVGWFKRGATPGALGPAVIAGHVTWNGAPDVFYRLKTMRRGDRVQVTREDGRIAVFRVTRIAQFPQARFPTEAVYGPIDHAGLRLITCGGTYDSASNRYLDNVVVFARLDSVRKASG